MDEISLNKLKGGMHAVHSGKVTKDEWITPLNIIKALGTFDLDPCAAINQPWPTASMHFTYLDNGLMLPWKGRVWCNPPYGKHTHQWLHKMAFHGNGIALIFARTETEMFRNYVWDHADAIFFFYGRIHFYHLDGTISKDNAGAPSCLVAYGSDNKFTLQNTSLPGKFISLK